jgi:CBS domain-containing protein
MLVRDVLSLKGSAIYSIESAEPLTRAVKLMVDRDVGSLVVTDGGRMVGMLTFREVLGAFNREGAIADLQTRDVMVSEVVCGTPGDTIDELRDLMTRAHVRYLPVKEGEQLLGIVSFHDVAKAVIKETSMENRLLKRYIESEPAERP